jgi:hypothetical protein
MMRLTDDLKIVVVSGGRSVKFSSEFSWGIGFKW